MDWSETGSGCVMKLALILFSILVLLAASVGASGYLLPATRQGVSVRSFDAARDVVRSIILDVESQPRWRSGIVAVEPGTTGAGSVRWTEVKPDGERIAFRRIEDRDDSIALGFESTRGYTGSWRARIAASSSGGTELTVTEEATTPSPLGRILSRLFFDPEAFASRYLDELGAEIARRRGEAA